MDKPLVSVSGVRGVVDSTFTEDMVRHWAQAFTKHRKRNSSGNKIVIGRDTRKSGERALDIVAEELQKMGFAPISVGIAPTPTIQLAVSHHEAAGAIIITASHNPKEWNGLKFLGADGVFLSGEEVKEITRLLDEFEDLPASQGFLSLEEDPDSIKRHVDNVLANLPLDLQLIKGKKISVALDPVNATGALVLPQLLEKLGCEVMCINCETSKDFSHQPEPTPENLSGLKQKVKEGSYDLGLATDPDADRLALIDEQGNALSEEYTITLAAYAALQALEDKKTPLVVNLSTTRMIDDVAEKFGVKCVRTAVGERHVIEGMRKEGSVIGGEGNGGVIFAPSHEGRDSLVGSALIIQLLAASGKTLSELISALPYYVRSKEKMSRTEDFSLTALEKSLPKNFPHGTISTTDGVKLDTKKGWIHVRPSNTEPVVRIIAEAETEKDMEKLIAPVKEIIKNPTQKLG